jgi:hypothetical protein
MDQDRIGRRRIAVQGVNTFMAVGLTLEQAIATVKHVMGASVFSVDADAQLSEDPQRRLKWWHKDMTENEIGIYDPDAITDGQGGYDPELGEAIGEGSFRIMALKELKHPDAK